MGGEKEGEKGRGMERECVCVFALKLINAMYLKHDGEYYNGEN